MPQGAVIEVVGAGKVRTDLAGLAERLRSPAVALERELDVLEHAEGALFDSLGGKYVQTGALRASLTERGASGSVRRVLGNTVEFGTSIWYARFQRTIGGPSGKPRGRTRSGPSKVLRFTAGMREEAVRIVAARIMRGA